ncbi:hypothetical protein MMB17_04335 [Methylobacterium organophilum]|uniref:hypothetical protein n=1 Tax=Methylobacterium organophilum TaxID=410 RepID=UPI001F141D52|nr:hypothetical protein [Methylobacterium organophilum]UMY18564.1 hypothetical protein MMB17_04335 [Methylobacterium organophilum]
MDRIAIEAARLLLSEAGAGWIVAVLLGLACLHLHREGTRAAQARIEEAGSTATALERASQTNAAVAAALEARSRVLEELARLVGEIAQGVDRSDGHARDRFDEILRRLAEIQGRARP